MVEPDGEGGVKIEVLREADAVARAGAAFIAAEARAAVAARGRFVLAISGGRTPWQMLRALADQPMPWADVHVVQVDERIAPTGDLDRNLTHLHESLLAHCPLDARHVHAMPVESPDLQAASDRYALTLREIAGSPRYSTSPIWGWALTATSPRSCPEIPSSTGSAKTSPSPGSTRGAGA